MLRATLEPMPLCARRVTAFLPLAIFVTDPWYSLQLARAMARRRRLRRCIILPSRIKVPILRFGIKSPRRSRHTDPRGKLIDFSPPYPGRQYFRHEDVELGSKVGGEPVPTGRTG